LARRRAKFDMIILDAPKFSRTKGGRAFHVEKDFEELIAAALEIAERYSKILLSTNCETLSEASLGRIAQYALKSSRRKRAFPRQPPAAEFPPGTGAKTAWLTLH